VLHRYCDKSVYNSGLGLLGSCVDLIVCMMLLSTFRECRPNKNPLTVELNQHVPVI
jgi:hypothetical protein